MNTVKPLKVTKVREGFNVEIMVTDEIRDTIEAEPCYDENPNKVDGKDIYKESMVLPIDGIGDVTFTYDVVFTGDVVSSKPEEGDILEGYYYGKNNDD